MTTWNPADKSTAIVLSNGNLTAASVGAAGQSVRSTTAKTSGKYYFEITAGTVATNLSLGIASATENLDQGSGLGTDLNAIAVYLVGPPQAVYFNGSQLASGSTASSNGDVVAFAVDFTAQKFWVSSAVMRAASTPWNDAATGTQNPSSGTGGISFSGIGVGVSIYAIMNDTTGGASVTATFQAPFNQTIPTGFTAWDVVVATGGPILVICD